VDYIHHAGFVHGDIKPSNILYNQERKCVLADFGSAVATGTCKAREFTVNYAAPEVLLDQGHLEPPCDMWSVGATFGEWVCSPTFVSHSIVIWLYSL